MAFEKGKSGNPGGRATDKPFADALRMELTAAGKDHKALRAIARQLIANATDGKMDAIKELADRVDGKVAQAIEGDFKHDVSDPLLDLLTKITTNGQRLLNVGDDQS